MTSLVLLNMLVNNIGFRLRSRDLYLALMKGRAVILSLKTVGGNWI